MIHSKMNSTQKLNKTFSKIRMPNSFCNSPPKRPQSQVKHLIIPQTSLIKQSLIHKNMKLNMMIRNLHSFATSIEELDWILVEAEKIISSYIKTTVDEKYTSNKIQVENLHKELLKLMERFSGLNKKEIEEIKMREQMMTENQNTMNMKKTATTRSFKPMQTEPYYENEQEYSEFSKIRLPSTLQDNLMEKERENAQMIKQYENTLHILKEQIEKEKQAKAKIRISLQDKINSLQTKLEEWKLNWKSYEVYAKGTIRKCKEYLGRFAEDQSVHKEQVENYLDELFHWENKLNNGIKNENQMSQLKEQMVEELAEVEFKLKEKKNEIRKLETYRNTHKSAEQPTFQYNNNIVAMLYAQATTIERLI